MVGETIRVLLVDDNTEYRTRLDRKPLRLQPGFEVIRRSRRGQPRGRTARARAVART